MKSLKIIGGVLVGFVFIISIYIFGVSNRSEPLSFGGAVVDANVGTTTDSLWANVPRVIASTTASGYAQSPAALGGSNISMLDSVIIGTTHASVVTLMDATSSTDVASTTIGVIAASPVIGSVFPFNVRILRGLVVNTATGFTGRYTITSKY